MKVEQLKNDRSLLMQMKMLQQSSWGEYCRCLHFPNTLTLFPPNFPGKAHLVLFKAWKAVNCVQHLIFIHAIVKNIFAAPAKVCH